MRRLILACTFVAACFADTSPAGDGGSTGTSCPEGSAGCPCYGNMTCDGDLACTDGVCLDPECIAGTENCPCLPSGGCDTGLQCTESDVCKPDPGGTSSAETGTSASSVGTSDVDTSAGTVVTSVSTMDTALEVGEVGGCMACPDNQFCEPMMSGCVPADPYLRCTSDADCINGGSCVASSPNESICAPPCDPVGSQCPFVPGLPNPVCADEDGDGMGACVLPCEMFPCPPEMLCTNYTPNLMVCMWY